MATLPKKVVERLLQEVPRYQKVLQAARDRDINEADTAAIVADMLAHVFGFEKYTEITSEFCIRSTYCDVAVKIGSEVQYLVEVKAIGLDLKENHLRQATDYAANHGVDWVVLTNGVTWCIHKVLFERPINNEKICELNMLDMNARRQDDQDRLFLLCKEGLGKNAMKEFHQHRQTVNRFLIGAICVSPTILDCLRRELRRVSPDIRVEVAEIEAILREEVIKREVLDGESAGKANQLLKKAASRQLRKIRTPKADGELPTSEDLQALPDTSPDEELIVTP